MDRYQNEIDGLNRDLRDMTAELNATITIISDLTKDIQGLNVTKDNIEAEIVKLNDREANIR